MQAEVCLTNLNTTCKWILFIQINTLNMSCCPSWTSVNLYLFLKNCNFKNLSPDWSQGNFHQAKYIYYFHCKWRFELIQSYNVFNKTHSMNTQKLQLFFSDLQSANYMHIVVTSVFFSKWIIEYRFSRPHFFLTVFNSYIL